MKTYTQIELTEVLRLHELWIAGDSAGVLTDLSGANLRGATGNMREIRSMQIDTWAIAYTADRMQIGCHNASIDEWRARTPDDVVVAYGAREWWEKWKTFILTAIDLAPATPTGHEGK